jgi:RHS repeat-associated protein
LIRWAGRRVQKQNTTTTRKYYFDFKHALEETDTNDVIQHEYTFNPGGGEYGDLLSQYDGTNTLYHEFDALGSTSPLISEGQAEVDKWVYRAFGLQTQTLGGDVNPFTFVGKQSYWRDSETELYLLDARYYDPASCRFLSEDPIGYPGRSVQGYTPGRSPGRQAVRSVPASARALDEWCRGKWYFPGRSAGRAGAYPNTRGLPRRHTANRAPPSRLAG